VLEREAPAPLPETQFIPETVPAVVSEPAEEDPYVVVEVLNVPIEQPPPLAPITQPIQVNQRSGLLPEIRNEAAASSSPLPRLDFSLAGQESGSISSLLFSEEGSQPGRMVVKLPQPGAGAYQFNPDDFIVPAVPREQLEPEQGEPREDLTPDEPEAVYREEESASFEDGLENFGDELPAIPLDDIELPSFEDTLSDETDSGPDISESYAGGEMIFPDLDKLPLPKDNAVALSWTENEVIPVSQPPLAKDLPWSVQPGSGSAEETGYRTLSTDWQSMDTQPIPTLGSIKAKRSDEAEGFPNGDFEGSSLHEGSVGKLFVRQPDGEPPIERQVSDFTRGPVESSDLKDEGDVLDELFGAPPGASKGMSKTAVVMLCGIGGAAVIATVVVIFLINLMGGLDPQAAYTGQTESVEPVAVEKGPASPAVLEEPSIDGAPPVIDPVAMLREESAATLRSTGAIPPPPAEAAIPKPEIGQDEATKPTEVEETPALSFDERVARVVNGSDPLIAAETPAESAIKTPVPDPVDSAINSFKGANPDASPTQAPAGDGSAPDSAATSRAGSSNYNPPATFPAPGASDSPLRNTNDLIDAFLRAPDWETRIKYTYQGESLRSAIGDYYGKWADKKIDRFSLQLFQMEKEPSLGGPFWVYLVSTSDQDQGFPLIVRVEDGNLKVDWEIYSEFFDRHFVRFRDGKMPRPSTFRVVVERVSDYYGSDREGFKDLASYNVYQINPPYGDLNEFSEYAFVKKDSEVAKKLDAVVGLNDEPLAVIITLDEKPFEHGVKHYLITEYVTEGWFR